MRGKHINFDTLNCIWTMASGILLFYSRKSIYSFERAVMKSAGLQDKEIAIAIASPHWSFRQRCVISMTVCNISYTAVRLLNCSEDVAIRDLYILMLPKTTLSPPVFVLLNKPSTITTTRVSSIPIDFWISLDIRPKLSLLRSEKTPGFAFCALHSTSWGWRCKVETFGEPNYTARTFFRSEECSNNLESISRMARPKIVQHLNTRVQLIGLLVPAGKSNHGRDYEDASFEFVIAFTRLEKIDWALYSIFWCVSL